MRKLPWRSLEKFEKNLFYLIVLFIPVNLAQHFVFSFSYVDGILVDYLIPAVYLTDILIWLLLLSWLFRCFRERFAKSLTVRTGELFVLFFVLISGASIFFAKNQPVAVYKGLKLLEYLFFSFYVARNVEFKKDWPAIVKLLSIGVLFESLLALAQWFNQGSIFGFWLFGENRYTAATPGIARLDFSAVTKVRSYGTFPHPNVLGGYLAIVLPWVFYELRSKFKIFYLVTLIFGLAALYFSFSRSAWLIGALGLFLTCFLLFWSRYLSLMILNSEFLILNSLSFVRRAELNWISLQMLRDHPLWGVGLNNFTVRMSEYGRVSGRTLFLQPVHNIYLLIASETGLFGLFLFLGLLLSAFRLLLKNRNYLLLISLTQIALLGLFDHYFWTIQQTSLLFWFVVGLSFLAYNRS
jgi:O-antigen ligase